MKPRAKRKRISKAELWRRLRAQSLVAAQCLWHRDRALASEMAALKTCCKLESKISALLLDVREAKARNGELEDRIIGKLGKWDGTDTGRYRLLCGRVLTMIERAHKCILYKTPGWLGLIDHAIDDLRTGPKLPPGETAQSLAAQLDTPCHRCNRPVRPELRATIDGHVFCDAICAKHYFNATDDDTPKRRPKWTINLAELAQCEQCRALFNEAEASLAYAGPRHWRAFCSPVCKENFALANPQKQIEIIHI
jgi:hypothetical protein